MSKCIEMISIVGRWIRDHWKQVFKGVFKVSLIVLAGFAIFLTYTIVEIEWDKNHGPYGGQLINEHNQIYIQYYADGTERVRNLKTRKWTTPKIRWAANEPPQDSISVFCDKKGLRGFYNTHTGKITLPGAYRHAWYFSDGVAAVVNEDGRLRFINYDGSQAVPGSYHYSQGHDYVFKDGLCEMYNDSTEAYGLLKKDGTWALAQEYQYFTRFNSAGVIITCNKKGQWQLFNEEFVPAIDGYFDALKMTDGFDGVYAVRNHVKQKMDLQGNVLETFIIDGSYELRYMVKYHEDVANEYELVPEVVVYRVDGYEGLMEKNSGKILTPAIYQDFEMISRNLIKATYASWQYESVVMDLRGKIIRYE